MAHWWGHTLYEKVIETVTEAVEDTVEDAVDYASDLTNRGLRGGLLGTMAEGAGDAANLIGQGARDAVSTVQRALDEVGSTVQKGTDMNWFNEDFISNFPGDLSPTSEHSGHKPPDRFAGTTNPHENNDIDDEYVDADERGANSSGASFYPKNVHGRSTNDMMRDVRNKAVDKLIMAGRWPSDENLQLSTIDHMIVAACAAAQQKVWDEWQEMPEDVEYSDSYQEYLDNKE